MTTIYDECSKDELLQIVSEMRDDLNQAHIEIRLLNKQIDTLIAENKELQSKFDDTTSELVGATNEYKLVSYEISVLNKYIDKLTTENNDLKFRFNMFKKLCLNSIYGITVPKHTDSIKSESEEKTNDIDN